MRVPSPKMGAVWNSVNKEAGPFAVVPGLDREGRVVGGEEYHEGFGDEVAEVRWCAIVSGPAVTMRLFFTVHRAADRVAKWPSEARTTLRWLTTSCGLRRTAGGWVAPATGGRRDTTRDGRAGVFTIEANVGGGGGGCEAGVGRGAGGGEALARAGVGGWAWGFRAQGFGTGAGVGVAGTGAEGRGGALDPIDGALEGVQSKAEGVPKGLKFSCKGGGGWAGREAERAQAQERERGGVAQGGGRLTEHANQGLSEFGQ
ncbi:hypothetical protein EDB85DRAFT_1902072 [Lactarius pseudohatsudake]|nr:hypothetical protein EDB85DRAFT_1902072 [Lactarius pseudohatsudake]